MMSAAVMPAGKRGDVEAGRAEQVAPGVVRQRLVHADARWTDAGAAENISHGQIRPSSLRAPGPRVPRAQPPPNPRTDTSGLHYAQIFYVSYFHRLLSLRVLQSTCSSHVSKLITPVKCQPG